MKYDLEERTAKFAQNIVISLKKVSVDHISRPLVTQLIRSASSIGANYMEANGSESKKDFIHKCSICKKEAKETKYFIRLLCDTYPEFKNNLEIFADEANQLSLIFGAITKKKV